MDICSRLINRDNPLPADYVPENLVPCQFPFLASGAEESGSSVYAPPHPPGG